MLSDNLPINNPVDAVAHAFVVSAETMSPAIMRCSLPQMLKLTDAFLPEDDGVYVVLLCSGSPLPIMSAPIVMNTWAQNVCQPSFYTALANAGPAAVLTADWNALDIVAAIRVVSPCKSRVVLRASVTETVVEPAIYWRIAETGSVEVPVTRFENHSTAWPLQLAEVYYRDDCALQKDIPAWVARTIGIFAMQVVHNAPSPAVGAELVRLYPGPYLMKVPSTGIFTTEASRLRCWYRMRQRSGPGMFDVSGSLIGSPETFLVTGIDSEHTRIHNPSTGNRKGSSRAENCYIVPPDGECITDYEIDRLVAMVTGHPRPVLRTAPNRILTATVDTGFDYSCTTAINKILKDVGITAFDTDVAFVHQQINCVSEYLTDALHLPPTAIPNDGAHVFAWASNFKCPNDLGCYARTIDPGVHRTNAVSSVYAVIVCDLHGRVTHFSEDAGVMGLAAFLAKAIRIRSASEELFDSLNFTFEISQETDPAYWFNNMEAYKPALLLLQAGGKLQPGTILNTHLVVQFECTPTPASPPHVASMRMPAKYKSFYRRIVPYSGEQDWIRKPRMALLESSEVVGLRDDVDIQTYCAVLDNRDEILGALWGDTVHAYIDRHTRQLGLLHKSQSLLRATKPILPDLPPVPVHTHALCHQGIPGMVPLALCTYGEMGMGMMGQHPFVSHQPSIITVDGKMQGLEQQVVALQAALQLATNSRAANERQTLAEFRHAGWNRASM